MVRCSRAKFNFRKYLKIWGYSNEICKAGSVIVAVALTTALPQFKKSAARTSDGHEC